MNQSNHIAFPVRRTDTLSFECWIQENKYTEAIQYYEPIVREVGDNVLSVTAIVLANLCVAYIMSGQVCEYIILRSNSFSDVHDFHPRLHNRTGGTPNIEMSSIIVV